MQFLPESIAALGEGALLLDGDTVYVYAPSWMLVIPRAHMHLPADVMETLAHYFGDTEVGLVDWRIISASAIILEEGKFLPWKGHRHADIKLSGYWWRSATLDVCRRRVDENAGSIWGEVASLSDLYLRGKADPLYAETSNEFGGSLSGTTRAVSYGFSFHGRVLRLDSTKFDAFYEMGFQVSAPLNYLESYRLYQPSAGLYSEEDGIVGLFAAEEDSRVSESSDGRCLLVDGARVCWKDEDEAISLMLDPLSYPITIRCSASAMAMNARCPSSLMEAIGWMRLNGWGEDAINDTYESGRTDAYHQQLRDLEYWVERTLRALGPDEGRSWESRGALNTLENTQEEIELLCEALGIEVYYDQIWELRQGLATLEGVA